MKKRLLKFLFCFTFSTTLTSQITIDETLTSQQIVEDVLVNNPEFTISNIVLSGGADFSSVNSIAAFDASASTFPFSGVVLSTGAAISIPGPNDTVLAEGDETLWGGDADLEAYTEITNSYNASSIQFDFTATIEYFAFNFIFASEEYNQEFECSFPDAFAALLTDNSTGITTNIAFIPTNNEPISISNIRPEVPNICEAVNETYFDTYNFEPFSPVADAPIDFNGQMVEFYIQGNIVVDTSYTLKLVIADATDSVYDSALFIKNEAFGLAADTDLDGVFDYNEDRNRNGDLTDDDTDNDMIPDYLDTDDDGDGILTIDEDYNNNVNPFDDDINENGIVDYLDSDKTILGLNEIENSLFSIVPNPASDYIIITSNSLKENTSIKLYSLQGQEIPLHQRAYQGGKLMVDISSIAKGVYFISVYLNGNEIIKKVIKK